MSEMAHGLCVDSSHSAVCPGCTSVQQLGNTDQQRMLLFSNIASELVLFQIIINFYGKEVR